MFNKPIRVPIGGNIQMSLNKVNYRLVFRQYGFRSCNPLSILAVLKVMIAILLLVSQCYSATNNATNSDDISNSKWYKQALAKMESDQKELAKKVLLLLDEYEKLDFKIRSMEKKWLGVTMPMSEDEKYSKWIADRIKILYQIADLYNQVHGTCIQLGDACIKNGAPLAAEAIFEVVINETKDSPIPRMKAAGRLLPIYSKRARAFDSRKDYYEAEIEWQKIVDMLGQNHPKVAEACSRLAFYAEQERIRKEKIANIKEPSLAGLRIGDPLSKAIDLYGNVYGTTKEVFGNKQDEYLWLPEVVYYSRQDKLWLAIWTYEFDEEVPIKRIVGLLVIDASDCEKYGRFNKDCEFQFKQITTSKGINVGENLDKAIRVYGGHENPIIGDTYYVSNVVAYLTSEFNESKPSGCSLSYPTGDDEGITITAPKADDSALDQIFDSSSRDSTILETSSLVFHFDEKTKRIIGYSIEYFGRSEY